MQTFSLDHLTETEFEQFCYDLLGEEGLINIDWRKGTGLSSSPSDSGRDIECLFMYEGIGGRKYFETWFVECKHYKQGVPPDKIQPALAWANLKRPDKLLIIASNFLSNPTKDYIKEYIKENKPSYKIETWERPDIERLTSGKSKLLRKYEISGDFPFLSIMHPAHITFLKSITATDINFLFDCLDRLEPAKRDNILAMVYEFTLRPQYRKPATSKETKGSLRNDEINYEAFKKKSYEIVKSDVIGQDMLSHFIISLALHYCLSVSDTTAVDEIVENEKELIEHLNEGIKKRQKGKDELTNMIELTEEQIIALPERIKRNYEDYVYFCENVIGKLLSEQYIRRLT